MCCLRAPAPLAGVDVSAAEVAYTDSGRHDPAKRRQSKRSGREAGCWTYIAAEQLAKAGYDPSGPAPFYRVWGSSRGGLFIRLYREA